MHAELAALDDSFLMQGKTLHLHSGVHAGMVLLSGGDIVRGKYEVLGDTTNAAARLCDAAGPGEILVSAETLGSAHHFLRWEIAVRLPWQAARPSSHPGRSPVGLVWGACMKPGRGKA